MLTCMWTPCSLYVDTHISPVRVCVQQAVLPTEKGCASRYDCQPTPESRPFHLLQQLLLRLRLLLLLWLILLLLLRLLPHCAYVCS